MPASPVVQFFYLLGLAICLFALWKGGSAERYGAGLILVVVVLARLAVSVFDPAVEPIIRLVGDATTALGLLVIVLIYGNLWLGGAMLLYAAQFTLHSYYFVTHRPNDLFHAMANNLDFLGIFACLSIGTVVSWRQRIRAGRAAGLAASAAPVPPEA
jgi:hypothetical protein